MELQIISLNILAKLEGVKLDAGLEVGTEAAILATIKYNTETNVPDLFGEFQSLFAKAAGVLGKEDEDGSITEVSFSVAETLLGPETFKVEFN
ncbi:hypothetical protein Q4603_21635 [Zobellia galactanivorans]|uniref:hypothetical protein n=1 Tax=Zobellia galactanivorans (strain DSM 12802 / CCUG 47099 / CIP 106680 / NCIMB 13871 / Dsij) TaxID=63186 RepID=UPI0026E15B88|nr:hypothetical protein [Zobellia galactanivorans]MDO6811234.1 hypothetical protein [Zobellia galactanivorans]